MMRKYANAKINIGLFIRGKRQDGYHEIQTLFYPVRDLFDTLTISIDSAAQDTTIALNGLEIEGSLQENLCYKAWKLLKDRFPEIAPLHIALDKKIPMGAGLGGGSSDAAQVLIACNELFSLQLPNNALQKIGVTIGADVPFFIENKPMIATGIGEILDPIELPFSFKVKIVFPGIPSNTSEAYKNLNPNNFTTSKDLRQLLLMPAETWKENILNDFEPSVFMRIPQLKQLKLDMYHEGAFYASMSGSGSAIYGLFYE